MDINSTQNKQLISEQERQRRLKHWEQAKASVALEGLQVTKESEKHALRYINGEISLEEFAGGY